MASSRATPVKPVTEATRERETFKYEPSLLSEYQFNRDGNVPRSSELSTPADLVLTALAQLGACQTGTDRAFVSLFDSSHQYVVAEATPSIRIVPGVPNGTNGQVLALCGSAIPRDQGTCDHVLYLAPSPDGADEGLPLSVVPNLAADGRFVTRPYCQFGEGGQFYAGVPIRTRRGINIGAYCVMKTTMPESWNEQSAQRLRDISCAITEHLELRRSRQEARHHVRVNKGFGSFIEGNGALSDWQSQAQTDGAYGGGIDLEGAVDNKQQHVDREKQRRENAPDTSEPQAGKTAAQTDPSPKPLSSTDDAPFKVDLPVAAPFKADLPVAAPVSPSVSSSRVGDMTLSSRVFPKASSVIREAFEVEGCTFLDVSLGSYVKPRSSSSENAIVKDGVAGHAFSASSSDEQSSLNQGVEPDSLCDFLGSSSKTAYTVTSAGLKSVKGVKSGQVTKRLLAKLLRQYPAGRIFNFDATGDLQSSDSSDEDDRKRPSRTPAITSSQASANSHDSTSKPVQPRRNSRQRQGALIHKAFPTARSVAFFPVWDPKRERWLAGGFIHTSAPTRTFSEQGEMSFLRAFGRLIAAEVLSLETSQNDKAKSDILGSLSHELRSPLHGVILATELLNDSDLTIFQGSATHTIETCCRTLLDTIEHLLDYSKVNSFAAPEKQTSSPKLSAYRKKSRPEQFGKTSLYRHTRIDGLIEEVMQSVFAGFNFQHLSVRQLHRENGTESRDTVALRRQDSEPSLGHPDGQGGQHLQFSNISVFISVDPASDWLFYTQSGALRRIVMNLFGNALKHTHKGCIKVSLSQEVSRGSKAERVVRLTVHDTGKGIGQDYMQHNLFKPFSQEDELSPGTGLGLSLVKMITKQLGGQISVQSQLGAGTTIVVTLPLEQSGPFKTPFTLADSDKDFEDRTRELRGLRVSISGFGSEWTAEGRPLVEDICRRWLHLDVVSDPDIQPDIALWSQDALPEFAEQAAPLAKTPIIVVCRDGLAAHHLSTAYEKAGRGQVFEFLPQPVGPRALARAMLLAYRRWVGSSENLLESRPSALQRALSSYTDGMPTLEKLAITTPPEVQQIEAFQPPGEGDESTAIASWPPPSLDAPAAEAVPSQPEHRAAYKFLLVDDNHINLKVLSAYMRRLGQTYDAAMNGQEAVDAYTQDPEAFAGILMDISMPVMDGLAATRQIRAHERRGQLRAVPVVALTGLASHRTHQDALESGVDVFLTKPVRLKSLDEALESMGVKQPPRADGGRL